jgi:hypothetical protein
MIINMNISSELKFNLTNNEYSIFYERTKNYQNEKLEDKIVEDKFEG